MSGTPALRLSIPGSPSALSSVDSPQGPKAKANLTIDDFQKVASGKYNAGNVVLTSKGGLDIVNNHRHWTFLNTKKISAEDAFETRAAFARALAASGVDDTKLEEVYKRLGVYEDSSLCGVKAFTPLTRQEVREIIDTYIGDINADPGRKVQLRTDDQIHARFSRADRDKQEGIRDKLNAAAEKTSSSPMQQELSQTLDVLFKTDKDLAGCSRDQLQEMKAFVADLRSALTRLDPTTRRSGVGRGPHVLELVDTENPGITHAVFKMDKDGKSNGISLGDSEILKGTLDGVMNRIKSALGEEVEPPKVQAGPVQTQGVPKAGTLPRITNQAEFEAFVSKLTCTVQYGTVTEDGLAKDPVGVPRKIFTFQGIVFRSDDRKPNAYTLTDGFLSQHELEDKDGNPDEANLMEAMGLGVLGKGEDGKDKSISLGATGWSGVSAAKDPGNAISYLNSGGTFYVIDTTKLPHDPQAPMKYKAWDIAEIFDANEFYNEAPNRPGLEVNVSRAPRSAIVGWVTIPFWANIEDRSTVEEKMRLFQAMLSKGPSSGVTIQFNPEYAA